MFDFFARPALAFATEAYSRRSLPTGEGPGGVKNLLLSVYDSIKNYSDKDRFYKRAKDKSCEELLREEDTAAQVEAYTRYYEEEERPHDPQDFEPVQPPEYPRPRRQKRAAPVAEEPDTYRQPIAIPKPEPTYIEPGPEESIIPDIDRPIQTEAAESGSCNCCSCCNCGCDTGSTGGSGPCGPDGCCDDQDGCLFGCGASGCDNSCAGVVPPSGAQNCWDDTGTTGPTGPTGPTGCTCGCEGCTCWCYTDENGNCQCTCSCEPTGGTGGGTGCIDADGYCHGYWDENGICHCSDTGSTGGTGGETGGTGGGTGCVDADGYCHGYLDENGVCHCSDTGSTGGTGGETGGTGGGTGCVDADGYCHGYLDENGVCHCSDTGSTGGTGGETGGTGGCCCRCCCEDPCDVCGRGAPGMSCDGESSQGACGTANTCGNTGCGCGCGCEDDETCECGDCCDCSYVCCTGGNSCRCRNTGCRYHVNGYCGKCVGCEDTTFENLPHRPHCGHIDEVTFEERPRYDEDLPANQLFTRLSGTRAARTDSGYPNRQAAAYYQSENRRILGE